MDAPMFPGLPDESRLWVIPLDAELGPERLPALESAMAELLGAWRHKGKAYEGRWRLEGGRCLLVAEPTMAAEPSGCAIEGFFTRLDARLRALGLGRLPEAFVLVEAEGWRAVPRTELGAWIREGRLGMETPVVDLSLFSVGQLRASGLLKPLRATWIARSHREALSAVG